MKVVLSRKGFDSGYGGCSSPILQDGTLLSMPIPENDGVSFEKLSYKGKTYYSIWMDLNPRVKKEGKKAHLDPDIRPGVRIEQVPDWKAIFGQCGTAQSHLINQGINEGDMFLFFGRFREVDNDNEKWSYKPNTCDKHVIFGYLQVGEIVTGDDRHKFQWHPHSEDYSVNDNTMYIASDELILEGFHTGLPGFGTLNYSPKLVLTKDGYSSSKWELPEFFKHISITYHSSNSFKEDYFQSAKRGQEFVIEEDERVTAWVKDLLQNN